MRDTIARVFCVIKLFPPHLFFVSQFGARQSEVTTLPPFEEFPLPSFFLFELSLDDGFRLLNESDGSVRVIAEEAAPVLLRPVVLEHVEETIRPQLVHQHVLVLRNEKFDSKNRPFLYNGIVKNLPLRAGKRQSRE